MTRLLLPYTHWQRFLQGLGIFALGLVAMLIGAWWWEPLYAAGLAILLGGFAWAMSGYLGLLWQRLTQSIKPPR